MAINRVTNPRSTTIEQVQMGDRVVRSEDFTFTAQRRGEEEFAQRVVLRFDGWKEDEAFAFAQWLASSMHTFNLVANGEWGR